MIKTSYITI